MKRTSAGRASLGTAPLRTMNGNSGARGTSRSKLPTVSGRSSFGSRSSIGSRPSIGGRLSIIKKPSGGMVQKTGLTSSRRSSGYGRSYGHEVIKDPRPVSNKAFKDQSIRKLVDFLSSNGYPHQLSHKMLISPIAKDFLHIFEFLYRFLDPNVKLSKKIEEEIPTSFKRWKYPFQISKSAMFAVGSPHTWPTLLAALTWLREMIECISDLDVDKALFQTGDFGDTSEPKYVFEYIEKSYKTFLAGEDTYDELEQELADKIRTCGEMADMDHIASESRTLREELQHLQEQPDQLLKKTELHASLSLDAEKIQDYDSTLDTYNKNKSDKEKQLSTELAEVEAELQAILKENERKQQIFKTQEFSLADVERINMERQELQRSIEGVETDIKNTEQQVWTEEVQLTKLQEGIDVMCKEYNQAAAQLRLVPASAENSGGHDYELTGKVPLYHQESQRFLNIIKPGLLQLKKQVKQLVRQATEECITEAEAVDQMAELVNEKEQALALFTTQHKRLEDSIDSSKQVFTADQEKLQAEIDSLQDDLFQLRKQSSQSLKEAQRQLDAKSRQVKLNEEARRKEEEEYMSFLEKVTEVIITHKTLIQDHTADVKQELDEAIKKDVERLQGMGFQVEVNIN